MAIRGIIYLTEASANAANVLLAELNHKPVEYIGLPPFEEPESKPYTNVYKHPTLNKWALSSTAEIEAFLNLTAEELTSDWFVNND